MARGNPGQRANPALKQYNLRKRKASQPIAGTETCATHQWNPSTLKNPAKRRRLSTEGNRNPHPVSYWLEQGRWPPPESPNNMQRLLARKTSVSSIRSRKRFEDVSIASTTPSDQRQREEKSTQYRDPRYELLLQTKGSYMKQCELGIKGESTDIIRNLRDAEQQYPEGTLFADDIFVQACEKLSGRNEAKILQDISRLLVPSAEAVTLFSENIPKTIIESINEGWNNAIPLTGSRPQPDYAVGFRRDAFTDAQLDKLSPFIGDFITGDQSYFMATYYMYFPFLSCEVKCGTAGLAVADRQNAHSMTLAVRGIAELFRLVKRQDEVDRQIVAFSVSHDDSSVRVYAHHASFADGGNGTAVKFYRHPVFKHDFTADDGKEKWTTYRFIRNIYEVWLPVHLAKLRSAVDDLPSVIDLSVEPLAAEVQVATPQSFSLDGTKSRRTARK
ncbi:hypothetical protein G3M48_002047 [Beauveria asiatica]|uniref:DUF7924 domain-containing protein n=1 Tax=Beauveria asiatica TaxID=1069075 RepID=A0AAW0RXZ5_9HYPO